MSRAEVSPWAYAALGGASLFAVNRYLRWREVNDAPPPEPPTYVPRYVIRSDVKAGEINWNSVASVHPAPLSVPGNIPMVRVMFRDGTSKDLPASRVPAAWAEEKARRAAAGQ